MGTVLVVSCGNPCIRHPGTRTIISLYSPSTVMRGAPPFQHVTVVWACFQYNIVISRFVSADIYAYAMVNPRNIHYIHCATPHAYHPGACVVPGVHARRVGDFTIRLVSSQTERRGGVEVKLPEWSRKAPIQCNTRARRFANKRTCPTIDDVSIVSCLGQTIPDRSCSRLLYYCTSRRKPVSCGTR